MAVSVTVCGPGRESDEYQAALRLKEIIMNSLPASALGEILLYANATLFGQAVKDIDILMAGYLQNYTVDAEFYANNEGYKKESVEIRSFCTTIEVKRHDVSGISLQGTDLYVDYSNGWHCVTEQSNKQKISAMEYFRRNIMTPLFVTNIIWFTQVTPGELRNLLSHDGNVLASNALGSSFDFKDLVRIIILEQTPYKYRGSFILSSTDDPNSIKQIRHVLSLFSTKKEQMGELTRKKIEQITSSSFISSELISSIDQVSICRGRAGTGKTVGLLHAAIHLVNEKQARVLFLTYNKALVSDIRRLLAFMELPDMFQPKCLHVNTMHSYFFHLANAVLFSKKANGSSFLENYDKILKELRDFMQDDEGITLVKEQCASDRELDWDYVLIDEAQDWSEVERDIILKMFDNDKVLIADGGQQFVRGIEACDWSVIRNRNNIRLKHCLRQKENLVSFINAYVQKLDVLGSKVLTKNNLPGGKVVIASDSDLYKVHKLENEKLQKAGNTNYDMLYLVPHSLVTKDYGESEFALKGQFERKGILVWDGTSAKNRDSYPVDLQEIRVLQYDSARGLEGWTVVCMDFDQFIAEKKAEYVDGEVNALLLESKEEREKKYICNWALIPLTRAIDTLIITIKDVESDTAKLLKSIADEFPDFVQWQC